MSNEFDFLTALLFLSTLISNAEQIIIPQIEAKKSTILLVYDSDFIPGKHNNKIEALTINCKNPSREELGLEIEIELALLKRS